MNNIADSNKNRAFQFINSIIDCRTSDFDRTTGFKEWKFNNQINVLLKAISYFNIFNIQPNKLKVKEISKFLEYCSFENNEEMQCKWATLLANALNPFNETVSLYVFMELLNQLSEEEVHILEMLYFRTLKETTEQKTCLTATFISKYFEIKKDSVYILLNNLERLLLVEKKYKQNQTEGVSDPYFGKEIIETKQETTVSLSSLGFAFLKNINIEL